MAYLVTDIIEWSKISQPLARYGEAKRAASGDDAADVDLDMKLYDTRIDVQNAYDADPTSNETYSSANYLLTLIGRYLFPAQQATGGGGSITPIVPGGVIPDEYDFDVDGSSFIVAGATSKTLPIEWSGLNILFIRGHITQSTVNNGVDTSYTWNKTTRILTLFNGAAQTGENFQIFPML